MYCKDKETQDPDSEETINTLKECLKFIYSYCNDKKITLQKYKTYIPGVVSDLLPDSAIPEVFYHLKNHHINFYTLHALYMDTAVKDIDTEIFNWFIPDFTDLYSKTRIKFLSSKSLKEKAKKGLKIIEQRLLKFSGQAL